MSDKLRSKICDICGEEMPERWPGGGWENICHFQLFEKIPNVQSAGRKRIKSFSHDYCLRCGKKVETFINSLIEEKKE